MALQRNFRWFLFLPWLMACQCSSPAQAPLPWSGPSCFSPPPICDTKLSCVNGLWQCGCINGETKTCYKGPKGTQGVGACKQGNQTCIFGTWSVCTGQITPNAKEKCGDNVDDNCNGQVDEGCQCTPGSVPRECGQTIGLCVAGQQACSPEGRWLACEGEKKPTQDICDNEDNDCDGQVDEDFKAKALGNRGLGEPCTSGRGACRTAGRYICGPQRISTVCSAVPKKKSVEVCDRVDNDCDGQVDEDFKTDVLGAKGLGQPCTVGVGACKASGVYKCKGDKKGTICGAKDGSAGAEKCDGVDNDCNGQIDESFPEQGKDCKVPNEKGVCAMGKRGCKNGQLTCPKRNQGGNETCNGLDDDCNGPVDDGLNRPNCAKQQGVCAGKKQRCGGNKGWVPCTTADYGNEYQDQEKNCDGKDNNCNGQVDEGLTRKCGTNNCATQKCENGQWKGSCDCGCNDGATQSCTPPNHPTCKKGKQVCNNKTWGACRYDCCQDGNDRDCYTHHDKSTIGVGECKEGTEKCVNGAWTGKCVDEVTPTRETCKDDEDSNCDGKKNERPPDCKP